MHLCLLLISKKIKHMLLHMLIFDEGTRIEITLENNMLTYLVHKKKIMHLRGVSLSILGLKNPVSHYQVKIY